MTFLSANIPTAGYGKKAVLQNINIDVHEGAIVALIGPNGSGKSTLLKVIMGIVPLTAGTISLGGRSITGLRPEEIVKCGMVLVPQGGRVFGSLSVLENLTVGREVPADSTSREANRYHESIFAMFPDLADKQLLRANLLSGGEKQQLALAHALMLRPKLLMLDEPSLGLSPRLVSETFTRLMQLSKELSISLLIVEQKVREVLRIAPRVYALREGAIAFAGASSDLSNDKMHQIFISGAEESKLRK